MLSTPSSSVAGEDYPHSCKDAAAVMASGKNYSVSSKWFTWHEPLLVAGYNGYLACFKDATDEVDKNRGYLGLLYADLTLAFFYANVAQVARLFDSETKTQAAKYHLRINRAYHSLRAAKTILDFAQQHQSRFDSDDWLTIDGRYKTYREITDGLRKSSFSKLATIPEMKRFERAAKTNRADGVEHRAFTAKVPRKDVAACLNPDQEAKMVTIVQPEFPESAHLQGATGVVLLAISLDDSGRVTNIDVSKSSGYVSLDQAAIAAARLTSYSPKISGCKPTPTVFESQYNLYGQ